MSSLTFISIEPAPPRDIEAWLQERRTGIGGSDAAPILGLSKWKTPLDVWREKRGLSEGTPDNPAMAWGRTLEPVVREWYARVTGRDVSVPASVLRHPEHPWMLATLDGLAGDRLLEIKTARTSAFWGEPGTDQIPRHYLLQVQHYLCVTGLPVADVAVLFSGQDACIYEVPSDPELQALIVEAEAEFWRMVVEGVQPEPISYADACARWGKAKVGGEVVAGYAEQEFVQMLRDVRSQIKALEERESDLQLEICKALADRGDTLVAPTGEVLCTWKATKDSRTTDWKGLCAALGATQEQIESHTALKPGSRRFTLK